MKKIVAVFLCMCMLASMTTAFAAKQNEDTRNVLFEDNFESYADGTDLPAKTGVLEQWSLRKKSTTSTTNVVQESAGNKAVCLTNSAETEGGPRIEKHFYLSQASNIRVEFRVKTAGTSVNFTAQMPDGNTKLANKVLSEGEWASYRIDMNFKTDTFDVYVDDLLSESGKSFTSTDRSEIKFVFTAYVSSGQAVYIDDVRFSTTDTLDLDYVGNGQVPFRTNEEIMAPFGKEKAPKVDLPEKSYLLFEYDGLYNGPNTVGFGSDATWSSKAAADYVHAAVIDGDELIRFTNPVVAPATKSLHKLLVLGEKPKDLTVAFYAKLKNSSISFKLTNASATKLSNTENFPISEKTTGLDPDAWTKVEITYNFQKSTYSVFVNDKAVYKNYAFDKSAEDCSEVNVNSDVKMAGADTLLLDNVVMYTTAEASLGSMKYYGTTGTNWALVGKDVPKGGYIENLRAHPRLIVNDRQALLDKIANDDQSAAWYADVKREADLVLNSSLSKYDAADNSIIAVCRAVENDMWYLGITYLVEQDRKYIDRALAEIRNVGTFPDWSNWAPICPSEMMYGIACAYDWMYDGLTPAERTEIIDVLKKQALWQFVRCYDGVLEKEINSGTSNRTLVANAAAAGVAIAIADEEPRLAQLLLDGAVEYAKPCFTEYGADGGFPEGTGYWRYATQFMYLMISELDNAVEDSFAMPKEISWYFEQPESINTPEYWMYMNGATSRFVYGDSSHGFFYNPLVYYAGERYNKPFYGWYLNQLMEKHGSNVDITPFAIAWYNPDIEWKNVGMPLDKTFNAKKNAQTASMRSSWSDEDMLYVAIQGGDNTQGHMMPSLGTFIVEANGKAFIKQNPKLDYDSSYDDALYYVARTESQNTIIVNPDKTVGQNTSAVASFVKHEEAENEAFTVLDMTQTNSAFTDAKRGVYMTPGRHSVVLQDEMKLNKPSEVYWFAHTSGDIALSADRKSALLTVDGERMYVAITNGPSDAVFEIMATEPLPTSPVQPPDAPSLGGFKLAVHMQNVTDATLAVEFVPLKAGEAAPEQLTPVKPISAWSVQDNTIPVNRQAGSVVALLLDSPNVLDMEKKTFVDTANTDVVPIVQNGRTLVPVRFISEAFGAKVGWAEATQTVTVTKGVNKIELQIGSDKMMVNGEVTTLDVPAQTINSRTLIPLRALVEALGKQVFWDDRGLIVISDEAVNYTEETKAGMIRLLGTRVLLNGKDMPSFTTDKQNYWLLTDGNIPTVTLTDGTPVVQSGNTASFTLAGKTYTITFVRDKFEGQFGTNSGDTVKELKLTASNRIEPPAYATWHPVSKVTFSTENEKYPPSGTIDNVILQELTTNIHHRWTGSSGNWIQYEFESEANLYAFGLATLFGTQRSYQFKAEVSTDGTTWTEVLNTSTSGTTNMPDIFNLGGEKTKYFRLTALGNSAGSSNSYTEVRFYTSEAQLNEDRQYWQTYFAEYDATAEVGQTVQILASGVTAAGEEIPVSGLKYSSDNALVATVDANGMITFVAAGTANITVQYDSAFGSIKKVFSVECK
ncbi:MAG: discoidin domain-containing protein [Clostridia bacterium]|nr:discoidin domain-containing protein [Clostridia bacterium]